jgi:hypothetical protein
MSSKINIGIFTIATLTLMVTASLFGAINNAEAQQSSRTQADLATANKILSYSKSGDLVNVAKPQINVDAETQVGASNTYSNSQSNVADTSNERCLICIEPIQYNIGVTTQVASDSNAAERDQSNIAKIGDRSDPLFVFGPQQKNLNILNQIDGIPVR